MQYKIKVANLKYAYYFNDMGGVYYYSRNDHKRRFAPLVYDTREVFDHEPGKTVRYITFPLVFLSGPSEWVDAADLMARTAFDIPSHFKGYTRPKNHNAADLTLKNLEFIQLDREGQRPVSIYDYNGNIPYNMYKEEASSVDKESMTVLPTKRTLKDPPEKERTDSVKMDLGERDRSVVAETLYILIEDRGYAVSNAVAVLMLEDTADVLRLYLEGRDSVYKTSDETIAKVNQEREKKGSLVRAQKEPLAQEYRDKGTDPIEPN